MVVVPSCCRCCSCWKQSLSLSLWDVLFTESCAGIRVRIMRITREENRIPNARSRICWHRMVSMSWSINGQEAGLCFYGVLTDNSTISAAAPTALIPQTITVEMLHGSGITNVSPGSLKDTVAKGRVLGKVASAGVHMITVGLLSLWGSLKPWRAAVSLFSTSRAFGLFQVLLQTKRMRE